MALFEFVELENFKRFGDRQRIELGHNPAVLIGPNNCGKTSVIQAIALWSQALGTWLEARRESTAAERTATPLNRLAILAVPVKRTRYFWHNTNVRRANETIRLTITVGVRWNQKTHEISMSFRNQGDDLIYCTPDGESRKNLELLEYASEINVDLLYPMSGLETEEPILVPNRVDVLLGQGQTAQVLRNLCLMVHNESTGDWLQVKQLMDRLFGVDLGDPYENARGSIDLTFRQQDVKEALDISVSGRGFQQMLLILAYLFSHQKSVLLIDEPDAHLEILRQKQVFVLLRDIANRNGSQVILVTHSEVILDEAVDTNLTLLLEGKADDLASKSDIKNALKHFGAAHYVRALERGYVLYVEGSTDVDMLRALAELIDHPVLTVWDDRMNVFYVQDNYPDLSLDQEIERVEGSFGVTPRTHFFGLRGVMPKLRGLAILDSDGKSRTGLSDGGLEVVYWKRYETENYFVRPELLLKFVRNSYQNEPLFAEADRASQILDQLIVEVVFDGKVDDFRTYNEASSDQKRLIWDTKTERIKLSSLAEEFFRRLSVDLGVAMLLRKGELHQLVKYASPEDIPDEVSSQLTKLEELFRCARLADDTRSI